MIPERSIEEADTSILDVLSHGESIICVEHVLNASDNSVACLVWPGRVESMQVRSGHSEFIVPTSTSIEWFAQVAAIGKARTLTVSDDGDPQEADSIRKSGAIVKVKKLSLRIPSIPSESRVIVKASWSPSVSGAFIVVAEAFFAEDGTKLIADASFVIKEW